MRFLKLFFRYRNRDSIIGIATSYMLDGPGFKSHQGKEISETVQTGSGTHPASCLKMGTGVLPGCENSPPSVLKLRMSGAILLLPLYAFMDRDSTFYLLYDDHKILCSGSRFTAAIMVHIVINVATPRTVVLLLTCSTDSQLGILYLTI
jgi:hypothetical protein